MFASGQEHTLMANQYLMLWTSKSKLLLICEKWGNGLSRLDKSDSNGPHEANYLKLDSSKLKTTFGWCPTWHIEETIFRVCEWTRAYFNGESIPDVMDKQIKAFVNQVNQYK